MFYRHIIEYMCENNTNKHVLPLYKYAIYYVSSSTSSNSVQTLNLNITKLWFTAGLVYYTLTLD